jgi:Integrase core domain
MESFFHSIKTETLYGLSFDTDQSLRRELLSYIQFYNPWASEVSRSDWLRSACSASKVLLETAWTASVWRYAEVNSFARASEEGNLLALHPTVKPVALS